VLGRRGTVFSRDEIARFWDSVANSANIATEAIVGFVDLFHAARILTVIGVNSVEILRLLRSGQTCAYLLEDQQTISSLRFDLGELEIYIGKVRNKRGWLTRSDVAERCDLSLRQVSQWISEGELKVDLTFGTTLYFYQDQVNDIASQLVRNGSIY
jgi:hypothetical protein